MIDVKLIIEWARIQRVTAKDTRAMLKDTWRARGIYWHKHFRPRHFSMRAYSLYGYRKRSRKYNERKRRHLKHIIPLVLTGELRGNTESYRPDATSNRVHVVYPHARKLNFRPKPRKDGTPMNMYEEFRTIALSEFRTMNRVQKQDIERRLQQMVRTRQTEVI